MILPQLPGGCMPSTTSPPVVPENPEAVVPDDPDDPPEDAKDTEAPPRGALYPENPPFPFGGPVIPVA
eukprot:CAMPEP_0180170148 /NCGR_PEP_ID=MMETSP0986-20121125/33663_1 /TAXON_ID=697907 /ORGANISM="non described non described, Strain CCMP2293" /LENGTH=67 /DNA_ID=CAMNT_0022121801 /DNA_START=113 /DNA_END=312 /DNA_ORIENTATION=+